MSHNEAPVRVVTQEDPAIRDAVKIGVQVIDLAKSYGSVQAVRGIDLTIAAGETAALLGPNGAGKTTSLDMVLGLRGPDRGEVLVFGVPATEAVRRGWVGGMLPGRVTAGPAKVRELVTLMASYYPHPIAVEEVLRRTGTRRHRRPRASKLSGGQAQQRSLCRCAGRRP